MGSWRLAVAAVVRTTVVEPAASARASAGDAAMTADCCTVQRSTRVGRCLAAGAGLR